MGILGTVHSCSGGAACDAASSISALVMFGFLIFIAIGLIVAFFGWVKGKATPPSPPAQKIQPNSRAPQVSPSMSVDRATVTQTGKSSVTGEFKKCPDCAEEVRAAALKCRFCDYMFGPERASR
jgi:hypothetical protein